MTQEPKNLWGNLPSVNKIKTPFTILKEQASLLTKMTQGLLVGEVTQPKMRQGLLEDQPFRQGLNQVQQEINQDLEVILRIKVPSLNSYTYSVLQVIYPIALYPVKVKNLTTQAFNYLLCNSKEEFENALGSILSSESVQRVISALLADLQVDELVNKRELVDENKEQS